MSRLCGGKKQKRTLKNPKQKCHHLAEETRFTNAGVAVLKLGHSTACGPDVPQQTYAWGATHLLQLFNFIVSKQSHLSQESLLRKRKYYFHQWLPYYPIIILK